MAHSGGPWKLQYARARAAKVRAMGLCCGCRKIPVEPHKVCEACAKKMRDRRALRKREIIDHYGGACTCCGETEPQFLSLDHVNNDGADHRRSLRKGKPRGYEGAAFYWWVVKAGFPTDLQLLCFNCNCAKGFYGICPHDAMREALLCA